ncbi:MAG TPA: molybdenum cofactor biosynthesis protein MoaE [Tepidisphaeraceae bacterium]|jgi:molybdopterin synthase catalytic subunit
MLIHVRFFAILRDRAGTPSWDLNCPPGTTIHQATEQIFSHFPNLAAYAQRIAYAVNQNWHTQHNAELHDGDELALLPPVSGGTEDDWIEILLKPIDCNAAIQFVSHPNAGGIDIFLGTTRAETNANGQELSALDYEAYNELAAKQLTTLAAEARKTWPITRLAILHRIGRVAIAEPSVLIAIACPHRSEAFEACKWLIDQLKKDVAIWKKEIWQGADPTWSGERC